MTKEENFKNEEIEATIERRAACEILLKVKGSPNLAKKAQKEAIKTVAKEVSLPGFRKGKAPQDIILKKFPKAVDEQSHKALANVLFQETQKLVKIPLLGHHSSISYDVKYYSVDDGCEVNFSFETEPSVPSVDPTKFHIKNVKRQHVGDKEINEAIRQARFFYAQWKEIIDRPVQEGDYVIIDLESIEKDPPLKVFSDTRFEVLDKSIAQWMKKLLIGAKKGDEIEGVSFPDDDLPEEEKKKFEPKKVLVKVKKIEEAILPEENDDFAKKLGANNVEEMKKSVAEMLNRQADEKFEKDKRDQVNHFLIESTSFDLPSSLVRTEKEHRLNHLKNDPHFKVRWEKMDQKEKDNFIKEIEKQARNSIALFYLSRKIVDDAKIPISNEEIQNEAQAIFLSQHKGQKPTDSKKISQEIYALALSKIMLAKAQDYILNK